MSLNADEPKNIPRHSLFLVSKHTGTIIQQTQRKPQETLDFTLTKSGESFSLDLPSQLENGEQMLGLTSFEVFNSNFNITNKKKNLNNLYFLRRKKNTFFEKI